MATLLEAETPAPPLPGATVACHRVADARDDGLLHVMAVEDVEPGGVCRIEAWVWLPPDFRGTHLSVVFLGYAALTATAADVARRGVWQRLSVTARVPDDAQSLAPCLVTDAPGGDTVFSAGWRLGALQPAVQGPPTVAARAYRILRLQEIIAAGLEDSQGRAVVTREPGLPLAMMPVPSIGYGQAMPVGGAVQWPVDDWLTSSYEVADTALYTLRDAVVHGEQGIVTVGDVVVAETLYLAQPELAGFTPGLPGHMLLAAAPPDVWLDVAAHCLCGYVGNRNYAHWWMDVVPALLVPPFHRAFDGATLVLPEIRHEWQRQTLNLLPEVQGRSVFLGATQRIGCTTLRLMPAITQSDLTPHPQRRALLNAMRQRAGIVGIPQRKLYVSRRDAAARPLVNDAEISALLEAHGFETVMLTGKPVAEQIRLFSSASHVVGAHGAGLVNILFCQPGAALCELQMLSNVQWTIRRMASVAALRYGCVIGRAEDDAAELHHRRWHVDPGELAAVLADPAFSAPPPPIIESTAPMHAGWRSVIARLTRRPAQPA